MKCFVDLDGVLVDFMGGICQAFGVTMDELNSKWKVGDWNCWAALGCDSEDAFWQRIDSVPTFWDNLGWMHDGKDILNACIQDYGEKNVCILSSPPRNPLATAAKVAWVQRELPQFRRRMFIGNEKFQLAHRGAVLVDDSDKNCDEFRRAGGHVVLVPRRWNSLHLNAGFAARYVAVTLPHVSLE